MPSANITTRYAKGGDIPYLENLLSVTGLAL